MKNANAGRSSRRPDRSNGVILQREESDRTIADWQAAMNAVRAHYLLAPGPDGRLRLTPER